MAKEKTYICALCLETFISEWSDDEAKAELAENWPGISVDQCELVCDDCFQKITQSDRKGELKL